MLTMKALRAILGFDSMSETILAHAERVVASRSLGV